MYVYELKESLFPCKNLNKIGMNIIASKVKKKKKKKKSHSKKKYAFVTHRRHVIWNGITLVTKKFTVIYNRNTNFLRMPPFIGVL